MSFLSSRLSRFLVLALALLDASAVPVRSKRSTGVSFDVVARRTRRRADGSVLNRRFGSSPVSSVGDTVYYTNVTLGGVPIEVVIDTGSSDLWTKIPIPNAKNLSIPMELGYAVGTAAGYIHSADLELGGYTIPDQAYMQANNVSDVVEDVKGIIGLGPKYNSLVRALVNSTAGATPLDRIFVQDPSASNMLTILMTRVSDDAAGPDPLDEKGQITIGALVEGLEDIVNTPKVPALTDRYGRAHWASYLDEGMILGPDEQPIYVKSTVQNSTEPSKLRVVYDTGYTLPQLPREVIDAIYGRVPGATYHKHDDLVATGGTPGYWSVPCNYELTATFVFGGLKIPIAPLDMTLKDEDEEDEGMCMATFQEASADFAASHGIDGILGMAFFRNAYFLVNYGDFVDGNLDTLADPYFQLLPITDMNDAHNDFVAIRRGGDTSYVQPPLLPVGQGQTSPAS